VLQDKEIPVLETVAERFLGAAGGVIFGVAEQTEELALWPLIFTADTTK
jgi:hypothetical protein